MQSQNLWLLLRIVNNSINNSFVLLFKCFTESFHNVWQLNSSSQRSMSDNTSLNTTIQIQWDFYPFIELWIFFRLQCSFSCWTKKFLYFYWTEAILKIWHKRILIRGEILVPGFCQVFELRKGKSGTKSPRGNFFCFEGVRNLQKFVRKSFGMWKKINRRSWLVWYSWQICF